MFSRFLEEFQEIWHGMAMLSPKGNFHLPHWVSLAGVAGLVLCNSKETSNVVSLVIASCDFTHWVQVTHICISKLTIIGSDNGLSPGRRQAIIWTNTGILLIGPLGTKVSGIIIEIDIFSFKKVHFKMSSGKWQPSCLGLNVLKGHPWCSCDDVTVMTLVCVAGCDYKMEISWFSGSHLTLTGHYVHGLWGTDRWSRKQWAKYNEVLLLYHKNVYNRHPVACSAGWGIGCFLWDLTHCGLVTSYGNVSLGQHWLREWLVAWWQQAITWASVDLSSKGFCGILRRTI